jgi:hypothetical protein
MAKQMNIGASDKKSIIIDDRLYLHPSHSLLSRATLLIHEYILSQMGVANGTTDRVRATVATLISKDATLLDMIRVAGANMGSTKVIPVSVDTLILEAGRIQAEINVSYSATSSTEAKTFIENHLYELPRKIRKRLEGKIALETINSCKEASLNAGCILSEQECNLFLDFVSRRNGQIAEKWNPIKEQIKAKYAPSWENLVNTALNKISYIRLTGVRRTALIEAVKASPYEKEYTASPAFYFDQSEVLFNEE